MVQNEGIKNAARYAQFADLTHAQCEDAIQFILKKIDENLETFTYKFPSSASRGNVYDAVDNTDWTACFWTGMLWLAYQNTKDEKYRKVAEIQLKSYQNRIEQRIATETHDLGFLYTLSCVFSYKLTGNVEAKRVALLAADVLMERYFEKAGIIQAWGSLDDPTQRGRMIIDCCMNLPLLYWASEQTGDPKYFNAARSHVRQAEKYIVRADASTFHTFYMDPETGAPRFGKTAQGFSDASCWARGQAWAIYGFPLSYAYTKDAELLDMTKKVANYYLNRLPEDEVCYWDLVFTSGDEERDSSSVPIVACGLLELIKYLPESDPDRAIYEKASQKMLLSLSENYTTKDCPESNGILLHAVYAKPQGSGIDECNIWGDYYYFEALTRLVTTEKKE